MNGMITGLVNVLRATGHKVTIWNSQDKPAFDVFDEVEPDYFLSHRVDLDRPVIKILNERKGRIKSVSLIRMPPAADTFTFFEGTYQPNLAADVACVGDVDQNTFDTLVAPFSDLNIKIVGDKHWPVPQYLGPISENTLRDLYKSATVSLVLKKDEPIYPIIASGGLPVVLGTVPDWFDNTSILQANTILGFEEIVRKILDRNMERTRKRYIEEGRKVIYKKHTYWHRVAGLFRTWNMPDEAERVIRTYHATVQV